MQTVFDLDPEPIKRKWRWPGRPPQVYLLALSAFLVGPISVFASTQMSALVIIVGGLCLVTNPVCGLGLFRGQWAAVPFCGLLLLGALSGLWAIEGAAVAERFWKMVSFGALALLVIGHARYLHSDDRWFVGASAVLGFLFFASLFVIERLSGSAISLMLSDLSAGELRTILDRPGTLLLLFSWPALGFLMVRKGALWGVVSAAIVVVCLIGVQGQMVVLAWGVGCIAALMAAVAPRVSAWLGSCVIGALFLSAPIVFNLDAVVRSFGQNASAVSRDATYRVLIWDFAAERIAERPITGWGLESSPDIPAADQSAFQRASDRNFSWVIERNANAIWRAAEVLPLHPHSVIFQTWLELGFLGAVSMALFLVFILFSITEGRRSVRAVRFGLFASAFTVACLSYGAWQSWWLASLALAACFASALPEPTRLTRQWPELKINRDGQNDPM